MSFAALGFLFGLMPRWGWLALIGIGAATLWGWHAYTTHQARNEGREEVRAEWRAEKAAAKEAQAEIERIKNRANTGVANAYQAKIETAKAAAAAAEHAARLGRAESDSLRDELHARDRANAAAAAIADEAAAAVIEFFGECRERRIALAREAGELAAQVGGLQDYAKHVCLDTEVH